MLLCLFHRNKKTPFWINLCWFSHVHVYEVLQISMFKITYKHHRYLDHISDHPSISLTMYLIQMFLRSIYQKYSMQACIFITFKCLLNMEYHKNIYFLHVYHSKFLNKNYIFYTCKYHTNWRNSWWYRCIIWIKGTNYMCK